MYLADRDLERLLQELDIVAANPDRPFEPDTQIQPCSIDLRLDTVFWKPRKHLPIDLRRAQLLELQPRRYYKRIDLRQDGHIIIRPGRLLLGRIYEAFTIPNGYAGMVVGRSSFARMGLSVHSTGSFLNPGYRGHMPLQLFNSSPTPIRMFPYLPICQLIIVKLTEDSQRVYGDDILGSKYVDDDGGPSYWWRDKLVRELHRQLGRTDLSVAVQEQVMRAMAPQEPEIIVRLEKHIDNLPVAKAGNADEILEGFARREDRRQWLRRTLVYSSRAAFPLLIGASVGSLFNRPYGGLHVALWVVMGLSLFLSWYAFRTDPGPHLTPRALASTRLDNSSG